MRPSGGKNRGTGNGAGQRVCPSCGVHSRICVCQHCRPIADAPELWVLQHPSERGRSKGTLRIAEACLPNLRVLVGETGDDFAPLRAQASPEHSAVLFPAASSCAIEVTQPQRPRIWILLDGSWRKARRIFLANPWLAELPQFHFQSPPLSAYRIRKSAREGRLSTVEAIGHLLWLTHPECDTRPLQAAPATHAAPRQ
jgi:DTW domain-containing protein YfiP